MITDCCNQIGPPSVWLQQPRMDNKTWPELSLSFKSTSKYADKRTLVITKPYGSFWSPCGMFQAAVAGSISAFLLVINAESRWRCGSQRAHFKIKTIPLNCCLPLISIFHLPPDLLGFKSCRSEISCSSVLKGNIEGTNPGGNNSCDRPLYGEIC